MCLDPEFLWKTVCFSEKKNYELARNNAQHCEDFLARRKFSLFAFLVRIIFFTGGSVKQETIKFVEGGSFGN